MGLASCHPTGAQSEETFSKFLENFCSPDVWYYLRTLSVAGQYLASRRPIVNEQANG